MQKHRLKLGILVYLLIGFSYSITPLFFQRGDLPRWDTVVEMVAELPGSANELMLFFIYLILLPALTWPLVPFFYLLTFLGR